MPVIAVDLRTNHNSGVARYGLSLLPHLVERAVGTADVDLMVIAHAKQAELVRSSLEGSPSKRIRVYAPANEEDRFVRRSPELRDVLLRDHVDLYYTCHYTVDIRCPVPFIYTVHDLTRIKFPDLGYSEDRFRSAYGQQELSALVADRETLRGMGYHGDLTLGLFQDYFFALNRYLAVSSEHVITVSATSAQDLERVLQVPRNRISLVPCGVDQTVFHKRHDAEVTTIRERFQLRGRYMLFVGRAEPHKQLSWILDVFSQLEESISRRLKLLVVGGYAEADPTLRRLATSDRTNNIVQFAGRVTDSELATLYSGCAGLVSASLNEGNNLPPLEALACGAEVLAPGIPALLETVGSYAHFYTPGDATSFGELLRAAANGTLPRRAGSFPPPSWDHSAALLWEVLYSSLRRAPTPTSVS